MRYARRVVVSLLLAALAATLGVFAWPPERIGFPWLKALFGPLHYAEGVGYDALMGAQGQRFDRVDPRIVVLGFDRADEVQLRETWPISRQTHAKVIRNLAKDGAKVIAYDVLFSTPSSPKADRALHQALEEAGNVVLTSRIDRGAGAVRRKSIEFPYHSDDETIDFEAHTRVGFAEVPVSADDIVRSMQAAIDFQDETYPSFPAAAYMAYQGISEGDISFDGEAVRIGPLTIPNTGGLAADPFPHEKPIPLARVDYPSGASTFPMPATFDQVAHGTFPPGTFRGKVVFVGLTGPQLIKETGEHYRTAFSRFRPEAVAGSVTMTEVPGVVLQALHFNALVNDTFVREAPAVTVWMVGFTSTFLAIVLVRRFSNFLGLLLVLACGCMIFGISWISLRVGEIHMPWIVPTFAMFTCAAGVGWLESGTIKRKWAGYVSPAVLEQILKSDENLAARRYEASVMFGDIRGFTTFSERHSPETVVDVLNRHLERLTRIISDEHGTIDKFMGDGILAVFGAPISFEGSAVAAVRAAWTMKVKATEEVEDSTGERHVLATGFGITTGPFLAGDVGSKQLRNWTVIGDVVNLASRLQGVTGEPDVIIDSATYALVRSHVEVHSLGAVSLKGKSQPVECYKVVAWSDQPIMPAT